MGVRITSFLGPRAGFGGATFARWPNLKRVLMCALHHDDELVAWAKR